VAQTGLPSFNVSAETTEFLYKAIDDVQNTIRFTDTKAGVVIVSSGIIAGYFLDAVSPLLKYVQESQPWVLCIVVAIGLFTLFAIIVTILSSLTAIRPISNASRHVNPDGVTSPVPFSINASPRMGFSDLFWEKRGSMMSLSVKELLQKVSANPSGQEISKTLAFELLKLSYIRDKKVYRTSRSMSWLVTSMFSVIAFSIFLRIFGWI
jgi:F0F1-type ATP synthase assembly protein I